MLFGIAGQIALKSGAVALADRRRAIRPPADDHRLRDLCAGALLYIVALKEIPVSVAFPSVAASYAVVAVLAHLLWNEPFGWPQLGGLVLIGGGILLIHQH